MVSCKGHISSKESRKEPRALFLISKDGKTISLSDDGDANKSGIGSNVAAVMLKDVSIMVIKSLQEYIITMMMRATLP